MSFLFVEGPAGRGAECAHTRTTDAATDPLQRIFLPLRSRASPPRGLSAVEVAERTAAGLANAQPRHSSHSLAAVANVVIGLVQECSAKRTRDRIALRTGENDPVPTHAGDAVLSGSAVVAGTGVVLAIVVAVRLSR